MRARPVDRGPPGRSGRWRIAGRGSPLNGAGALSGPRRVTVPGAQVRLAACSSGREGGARRMTVRTLKYGSPYDGAGRLSRGRRVTVWGVGVKLPA